MPLDSTNVQLLPEPSEPGMMTVIDRDASGYDEVPSRLIRSPPNERSWRGFALVVFLAIIVLAYPMIESILFLSNSIFILFALSKAEVSFLFIIGIKAIS